MIINDTIALEKGLRAEFIRTVLSNKLAALLPQLAMIAPSNAKEEKYAWFGESPQMEELKDQRKYSGLSEGSFTIVNKTWANGMQVRKEEIDDDQIGVIKSRVQRLAQRAARHPAKLLFEVLEDNPVGYDGVSLFNDAHPVRGKESGTQDNLLAGTGVTVSALKTDLGTAAAQMGNFEDEAGEPFFEMLDPSELVVMCGPTLNVPMREALTATIISNTTNVLGSVISGGLVINPLLADSNDWYLMNVGDAVKLLVFQAREALSFEAQEKGTDSFMDRRVYKYGANARYNAGPGMWQYGVKTTNA